ncbi:hypothetical protein [Streptomyces natalensis]|uniref:Uncharacterized protein n=1 Tax=Streptomyces natalensis ATCC 27448 TaxID=1240678 RepID=A0A0D7CG80_9ACTN|nr:hypothetical protein [Streptomyces natalensis]KIZ15046.1 hypothetical protein SNA_29430 [Streptomyces natalensis ATCC 27448]
MEIPGVDDVLVEGLKEGIEGSVPFEGSEVTPETLAAHKESVGDFLHGKWKQGVLKGSSAEEAFAVQCDEKNNPPATQAKGIVTCHIAIAPVRPAEFIMFEIQQTTFETA